jgi:hypothetical protein
MERLEHSRLFSRFRLRFQLKFTVAEACCRKKSVRRPTTRSRTAPELSETECGLHETQEAAVFANFERNVTPHNALKPTLKGLRSRMSKVRILQGVLSFESATKTAAPGGFDALAP